MKINRRLILLVTVPLAVAVTFSVLALAPATSQALQAHRLTLMVDAAGAASDLAHRLQRERAAATALVAGHGTASTFKKTSEATDASIDRFTPQREKLSSLPNNAQNAIEDLDRALEELPTMRAQVRSGNSTFANLLFGYRIPIALLVDYRDGIAQADGVDSGVADQIRAAASMSQAAEQFGQQQVTVMRALGSGGLTLTSRRAFETARIGYLDSTRSMFALGRDEWRTLLEKKLSGPTAAKSQLLVDEVGRQVLNPELGGVKAEDWYKGTVENAALIRSVESDIDSDVREAVGERRETLTWWAVAEAVLVLLMLVGTIIFAVRLGRVIIHRLRDLRNAAHDVAHEHLPRMMKELSRPGSVSRATPEEIAAQSSSLVHTTSEDEIGQVGEAFNAVHYEAVRLAAQQAHSRTQFAETLVGAARRGGRLTSEMVAELDQVQRDESDPERMQVLFALDHLAIRMERNTNNLLVLGGYGQGRVRTADVPCSTVIVAAAQQVERFERVEMGSIDPDIGIAARVVHDLAHILAELLDNAIKFSPPESQVGVAVWRLSDRAVVQIVDEGVGLTDTRREELNADLAEPRGDVGAVRFMGLHVVSRLAARHDISVELRESAGPGTIAEVTLPSTVLAKNPERDEIASSPVAAAEQLLKAAGASGAKGLGSGQGGRANGPSAAASGAKDSTQPGTRRSPEWSRPPGEDAPREGRGTPDARGRTEPHGFAATTPPHAAEHGPVVRVPGEQDSRGPASTPPSSEPHPRDHTPPSFSPRPRPQPQEETPPPASGGTTQSGLPVRPRQGSGAPTPRPGSLREGGSREASSPSPKRRDSRQISDVLAAYTQGISRSTSRREPAGRETERAQRETDREPRDDDQQRSNR